MAGQRIALHRGDGAVVEAATGIELRIEPAVEGLCRELLLGGEGVSEAAAAIAIGVAVTIRVVAEVCGIPDRVEAGALLIASLGYHAPRLGATTDAGGELPGIVGAITCTRVCAKTASRASREHLHHAPDRVRPVQTGGGTAQNLDVVYLREWDRLEWRRSGA